MHFGEYELSPSLIGLRNYVCNLYTIDNNWPFTPTLSSSVSFSTLIGAVLQLVLPNLQPDQG